MRKTGNKELRNLYVQAIVCIGTKQTLDRPVVLAWKNRLRSDTPGQWELPYECVYQVKYNDTCSYVVETARVVSDHTRFVLRGSWMPTVELQRDKSLTRIGHTY